MKRLLVLLSVTLMVGGCGKAAPLDGHLERADRAYAAGDYETARIGYLEALRLEPDHVRATAQLAILLFDQGSLPRAASLLSHSLQLDPQNVQVRFRWALLHAGAGDAEMARAEADSILDLEPANGEALLLLADLAVTPADKAALRERISVLRSQTGERAAQHVAEAQLLMSEGRDPAAQESVDRALELDAGFAPAYMAQAALHLSRTNLLEAERAFAAAATLSPLRSERRIRQLQFQRSVGATDEARRLAEELVDRAPDYLPAWQFLAQAAFDDKDHGESLRIIEQIMRQEPAHVEANVLRGWVQLSRQDAVVALEALSQLVQMYPRNPVFHYQLALAHLLKQDLGSALPRLSRAIELNPDAVEPGMLLAQLQLSRGESETAIQSLANLAAMHQGDPRVRLAWAQTLRESGRLSEALVVSENCRRDFPDEPQAHVLVALVLRQLERVDDARLAFARALELEPGHPVASAQLVELDLAAGRLEAALDRAEAFARGNPDLASAHLVLGRVLLAAGRPGPAELTLRRALGLDPTSRALQLMLARLYTDAGRSAEALVELEAIASRDTHDPGVLMLIGTLHSEGRNYPQARMAYERALAIDPHYVPALNNLAYLLAEHFDQLDRAYELASRARTLQPSDPSIADTLGWIHFKRGDYSGALGLLLESAAALQTEPEIQFHLGLAHSMLGNEVPARAALEASLEGAQDAPWRAIAERRLEILWMEPRTVDIGRLQRAVRDDPTDLIARLRLSSAYEAAGELDEAIRVCLGATELSPEAFTVQAYLAGLYGRQPEGAAKALAQARHARRLAPTDVEVAMTLGHVALQAGDHEWALTLLEQAASDGREDPGLFYDLAWARYSVGRIPDALDAMHRAQRLGLDPRHVMRAAWYLELAPLSGALGDTTAGFEQVEERGE
jgi:tetratricopeptide (TPR) repeat protein